MSADTVDLEAIRARHVEQSHWEKADDGVLTYVIDGCGGCSSASPNGLQVEWPCDAVTLADALAASEAARQEAREVLRLARDFMRHKRSCSQWTHPSAGGPPCDCDYFDASERVRAALDSGHQEGGE